jgi:hypothetical protein
MKKKKSSQKPSATAPVRPSKRAGIPIAVKIVPKTYLCTKCKVPKAADLFAKDKTSTARDGHSCWCLACHQKSNAAYRQRKAVIQAATAKTVQPKIRSKKPLPASDRLIDAVVDDIVKATMGPRRMKQPEIAVELL